MRKSLRKMPSALTWIKVSSSSTTRSRCRSSTISASAAVHLHWFLRIVPRLTVQAGFEVGAGMNINPSLPESDAAYLRRV